MPGCVLRVSGTHFEPQRFLDRSPFTPCNIFREGEPRSQTSQWNSSGFTVVVSEDSGTDLESQVRDALSFLRVNKEELLRLRSCEGVTDVRLDFGLSKRKGFVQCNYLPPELLELAGGLKVGIEVSIYGED